MAQQLVGPHKVSVFHLFIFKKSGKSTIIRNLAVRHHFVSYFVFFSSIRVDPGPTNRGPTSLLALKIRTPVANTGKLRSIGQMPVIYIEMALCDNYQRTITPSKARAVG